MKMILSKASKMKDLKHPAKSLYQNELNLEDEILASEDDYHIMIEIFYHSHREAQFSKQCPRVRKMFPSDYSCY